MNILDLIKVVEKLPDPGTMPYEHNEVLKHLLIEIAQILKELYQPLD